MGARFPSMKVVGPAFPNGHNRTTSLAWVQQQSAERETLKSVCCQSWRGEMSGR